MKRERLTQIVLVGVIDRKGKGDALASPVVEDYVIAA